MPTQVTTQLTAITQGRTHVPTNEFGKLVGRAAQTIRKNYCLSGEYLGVRPLKVGGRLLWPVADIASLLSAEAA